MTRTDPPDILASTLFHDIISPASPTGPTHIPDSAHHSITSSPVSCDIITCDRPTMGTLPLDNRHDVINKRQTVGTLPLEHRHDAISRRQTVGTLPLDRRHDVITKRQTVGTLPLDHGHEVINKRHCRSFDFIESLDDPKCFASATAAAHSPDPSQDAEGQGGGGPKEGNWNGLGRPGHLRFSSPDLFNTKPPVTAETVTGGDGKASKVRSKSTPRVRTTLTPVPIPVSPPSGRRGKDSLRRAEVLVPGPGSAVGRDASQYPQRALVNEVHPIKLQPQTPLYVSDCFEDPSLSTATAAAAEMKPSTSPHVRCRVDIKPDAAVIQHASRRSSAALQRPDHAWQRSSVTFGHHRHANTVSSRTPTPSECYDYRHPYAAYPYPPCTSVSYAHLAEAPLGRAPSPRELAHGYRTLSTPNIPTKFFYTEDSAAPCGFPAPRCYYDDQFSMTSSASHIPSLGSQYGPDPRARWVHTLPVRPCYGAEGRLSRHPSMESWCQRPYSVTEPGPYCTPPPPPPGAYYRDELRGGYPYAPPDPRVFYGRPCLSVAEYGMPGRGYYTEGGRHPHPHPHPHPQARSSQVFSESDWQRSSISSHYASSQATPQRVRHDPPALTPWYHGNEFGEFGRLGAEARHYSRSWDNILAPPPQEREREVTFARGRSYENLFNRPRHAPPPSDPRQQQQPVIVTLSSSPRRYAALSVSENSLDRCHGNAPGNSGAMNRNWYVTPEITITDNDLRGVARQRKQDAPTACVVPPTTSSSVSWGVSNGVRGPPSTFSSQQVTGASVANRKHGTSFTLPQQRSLDSKPERYFLQQSLDGKPERYFHQQSLDGKPERYFHQQSLDGKPERYFHQQSLDGKPERYSLQQSLEQLDELLADLVVDYKPPQTEPPPSADFLDQLKELMTEDNEDIANGNVNIDGTKVDEKPKSLGSPEQPLANTPLDSSSSPSAKMSPDTPRDPDSGCDGGLPPGMEELSANASPEELGEVEGEGEDNSMTCSNARCGRKETLFHACLYFKSCHSCYTFYCSRRCRREDWDAHKESCLYGRISSVCRHVLKHCRETAEIHRSFSRVAKVGFLSRGRGVLFLGFPNAVAADTFLKVGLESLLMAPTYLSLRELDGFKDNLGEYCGELTRAGAEYDPAECFLLNVSVAVGDLVPGNKPSPRVQTPTVRKYAKVSLASSSPDKRVQRRENDMETLILTPPPGTTADMDGGGEEGRKAREVCFINIQRELRTRGVFLRHEYGHVYRQLCDFVENNKRFTPTTIYPIDKRTGKQFMCMIMAASEPRTLDWVATPHLLDDII